MPRKRKQSSVLVHAVSLDLLWEHGKWETITAMAVANHVSLADMVDLILDDWAARANHALGDTSVPLVLETEEEAKRRER